MSSLPDFVKLAESYGHIGVKITNPATLKEQLTEAFELKDRLVLIDITVDTSEHVYPMQIKESSRSPMSQMWLSKTERT
jgi:acetolactate synthase-1/2/3 large subunit